jgi:hypothetical protein
MQQELLMTLLSDQIEFYSALYGMVEKHKCDYGKKFIFKFGNFFLTSLIHLTHFTHTHVCAYNT